MPGAVRTVLGTIPGDELGVVAVHETLLHVLPGAQHAYDLDLDRAEIFAAIAAKLRAFKAAGGGTIVDASGMFAGRDLPLYEALARATGVHIVASSGQMHEAMLGGYFLTPQTNPPTPWPAEKFAKLYGDEATAGMVVPRVERRAPAGLIAVAVTPEGATATDESQLRGAARAARDSGTALSIRTGPDAATELDLAVGEGLAPERVIVGDLDRRGRAERAHRVAESGAVVAIDHAGSSDAEHLGDDERVELVANLVEAGHADRVLLSASATGAAFGEPGNDVPFEHVLTDLAPRLRERGVAADAIDRILVANPRTLLTGGN